MAYKLYVQDESIACITIEKGLVLVSHGQTLFLRRSVISCSISAPHEKGLVWFTGLTGTETTIMVVVVN